MIEASNKNVYMTFMRMQTNTFPQNDGDPPPWMSTELLGLQAVFTGGHNNTGWTHFADKRALFFPWLRTFHLEVWNEKDFLHRRPERQTQLNYCAIWAYRYRLLQPGKLRSFAYYVCDSLGFRLDWPALNTILVALKREILSLLKFLLRHLMKKLEKYFMGLITRACC
jgi:hypothetical protein